MTSTVKSKTTLDVSALVPGTISDAADLTVPYGELETEADEARQTVSVSPDDTHVKHLADALQVGDYLRLTPTNASADAALQLSHHSGGAASGSVMTPDPNGTRQFVWVDPATLSTSTLDVATIAAETLGIRKYVYIDPNQGAFLASSRQSDVLRSGTVRGFVVSPDSGFIAAGTPVTVRIFGTVDGFTNISRTPYYAETNGTIVGQQFNSQFYDTFRMVNGDTRILTRVGTGVFPDRLIVFPATSIYMHGRALPANGYATVLHHPDTGAAGGVFPRRVARAFKATYQVLNGVAQFTAIESEYVVGAGGDIDVTFEDPVRTRFTNQTEASITAIFTVELA